MSETNRTLSIAAIIISVIALLVAFAANTDVDVPNVDTAEIAQETELALARAEARASLAATRADLAIDENYEEAANEVAAVRAELARSYKNANAEAQAEFKEVDAELEALETELREESADALNTLENLIGDLEREVRTDE